MADDLDRLTIEALLLGADPPDLAALLARPAWHEHAACRGRGPAAWYQRRGESLDAAREVCASCPVAVECAEAGARESFGVWAGTSARQRRRLAAA